MISAVTALAGLVPLSALGFAGVAGAFRFARRARLARSNRAVPAGAIARTERARRRAARLQAERGLDECYAHLGLNFWIPPSGAGRVYHTEVPGYRIAAGLPCAFHASNLSALFAEFDASCKVSGKKPLYFGLPYWALGFLNGKRARWHVGDLPLFDLSRWRNDFSLPANIRTQAQRARNHGVTVRHFRNQPSSAAEADSLSTVVHDWLQGKPIPPLRFLTTPYLLQPWPREGVFVAERNENGACRVVGILIPSRALFGDVYRVDAVIRAPDAPNGCAELLVREAFRHAAMRGIQRATMGLAPLSRRSGVRTRGWPNRVSALVRRLGSHWYSFEGLEVFKAKFAPEEWVPLYCVASGPRFTIADLMAVGRAFAGGSLRRYAADCLRWSGRGGALITFARNGFVRSRRGIPKPASNEGVVRETIAAFFRPAHPVEPDSRNPSGRLYDRGRSRSYGGAER